MEYIDEKGLWRVEGNVKLLIEPSEEYLEEQRLENEIREQEQLELEEIERLEQEEVERLTLENDELKQALKILLGVEE